MITPNFTPITISLIEASELISSANIDAEFWGKLSESNPPFSWGDNNRSLVTASVFRQACEFTFENDPDDSYVDDDGELLPYITQFLDMLETLGETYIDLEN